MKRRIGGIGYGRERSMGRRGGWEKNVRMRRMGDRGGERRKRRDEGGGEGPREGIMVVSGVNSS